MQQQSNNLNILRLCLAILVIYSHSFTLLSGTLDPFPALSGYQLDLWWDHAIDFGHMAVYAFFVISGYLITQSWTHSRSLWSYIVKRVLRIYPGFIVAVLLCLTIVGPIGASDAYWTLFSPAQFAQSMLTLTPAFPDSFVGLPVPGINGSLWTIPFEFGCYLLLPIVFTVFRIAPRRVRPALPALFFVGVYTVYSLQVAHNERTHIVLNRLIPYAADSWPRFVVYFAAGMCLYSYRHSIPYTLRLLGAAVLVCIAAMFVPPALPYILPLFGSYAILNLAFNPAIRLPRATWDLSYGVYLYGFPVQQLFVLFCGAALTPYTLCILATGVALLLAALSWHGIERPALRLKPKHETPIPSFTAAPSTSDSQYSRH